MATARSSDTGRIGALNVRARRKRFLLILAAVAIGSCLSACAGILAGRALALREAMAWLGLNAASAGQTLDSYASETRHLLAVMNASPFAFCSENELGYFRRMLYQSSFVREGGRMRNGRIACSAVVGRTALTGAVMNPGLLEPDGARLYWDHPAFRVGSQPMTAVQMGDSYVVTDFRIRKEGMPPFVRLAVHLRGAAAGAIEDGQSDGASAFRSDGEAMSGDTLYATRCTAQFAHCVTASMPAAEALHADRKQFIAVVALSALAGAAFGLVWALLYSRNCSTEQQLRRALARDQLKVVYQPVVDLATGRQVGAEALARWAGEDGVPVSPEVFVRIAEQRGFVGEITRCVLRHVLRDCAPVFRRHPDFRVSMNVAAADLSDSGFAPMMEQALNAAGVSPANLVIELTETCVAQREEAIETIRRLRAKGHQVHIDDFGTGYSSLSYLKDLAVDAIKIDRSFTQVIGTDSVTVDILPQILSLAEALGLRVVVEGIETPEQAAYFAGSRRPILAQGWLFGQPVPIERLVPGLASENLPTAREPLGEEETCFALPVNAG